MVCLNFQLYIEGGNSILVNCEIEIIDYISEEFLRVVNSSPIFGSLIPSKNYSGRTLILRNSVFIEIPQNFTEFHNFIPVE